MPTEFLREIAGPSGPLEARLDLPSGPVRAVAVFGHPHPLHGGTMHTKALYQTAKALTRIGVAALRFNFRGVGRSAGTFDAGPGEQDDFRAALTFAEQRFPGLPIWAAGMSFGSWIAASVGAADPRVSLLLLVAPPVDRYDYSVARHRRQAQVHRPRRRRRAHLGGKAVRKLLRARSPNRRNWCVIEDANHLFDGKTTLVGDAVEELLADWKA